MSDIVTDGNGAVQSTPPRPPFTDRLSLLPNELLDSIFESAYCTSPPKAPISKHLYPFFEQHFYRQVQLSSPRQVDLLLDTLSVHPERGELVKSLEFDRERDDVVKSLNVLEALFPLLPNLIHLEVEAGLLDVGTRTKRIFSLLSKVTSVLTEPKLNDSHEADLNSLAFLEALPSLSSLTVLGWPIDAYSLHEEEEAFQLSHVKTLRIEGWGADENSIKPLVDLCPALLSATLSTTYTASSISYGRALEVLPSTIHSLKLESGYASIFPQDGLLLRFAQLRHLDLDKGCYSESIHSALSHLPLLIDIRLGRGTIDPFGFLTLVSGPTRLVNLKQIILDFEIGRRGRRISYESRSTLDEDDQMKDWELSQDIEDGGDGYVDGLAQLVSVAESNGVEVRGTVRHALSVVHEYWIEANNRAVLALQSKSQQQELIQEDFDHLRNVRRLAAYYQVSLPQLDIGSLDLTRLELVTVDLPERGWWMYSLKNAGQSL